MSSLRALLLCAMACATSPTAQRPARVTRVVTGPAETPHAVYELQLRRGGALRLPATGALRCSVSPSEAFTLTRAQASIDVVGGSHEGWSMLRIVHDTGARSLYRFFHSGTSPARSCGEDCYDMHVGQAQTHPIDHVSSYSEGIPNVIETRVTPTEFLFVATRPGTTSVLLIRDDGTQKTLRFHVHDEITTRSLTAPSRQLDLECESHSDCDSGECVQGLCATWRTVDCNPQSVST